MYQVRDEDPFIPLSQLPREELAYIAGGGAINVVESETDAAHDTDVTQRYAAILLKERP